MPKLSTNKYTGQDNGEQSTTVAAISHTLRSSQKVRQFPHESNSLIFVGISRRRADVAAVRQHLRQRRHQRRQQQQQLRRPLRRLQRKRPVSSPVDGNVAAEVEAMLPAVVLNSGTLEMSHRTTATFNPATTPTHTVAIINDAVSATNGTGNDEVQCLFYNMCVDFTECTPRSGQQSPRRQLNDDYVIAAPDEYDGTNNARHVSGAMATASAETWAERLATVDGLEHPFIPLNPCWQVNATELHTREDEFELFLNDIRQSRS